MERMTKKVLHIIGGFSVGGAEMMLYKILSKAKEDKDKEYRVFSLTNLEPIGLEIQKMGLNVTNYELKKKPLKGLFLLMRDFVVYKPDTVSAWMYHSNILSVFLKIFTFSKAKIIWNIRHTPSKIKEEKISIRILIFLGKLLQFFVNKIIYNSTVSKNLHEDLGYDQKKSVFIPNGFDVQYLCSDPLIREAERKKLGVENDFVVGHLARYHPMKNHKVFIQAAVQLLDKSNDYVFVLAGKNITDSNQDLISLIPKDRREQFHFLGEITETKSFYNSLDLFCVTSSWGEGFPNVIGEALSCETLSITTRVGDSAYAVGNQKFCIKIDDVDSLANKIEELKIFTNEKRGQYKKEARDYIVSNFSLGSIAKQYAGYY